MRKFLVLWVSQAISLFGSAIVEFALAWYLTLRTGSATVLATAMLVAFLPPILLGPLIGPLVDRWNRKLIMISADLFITLVTVGLVVLFFTHSIQVWQVYVALVFRSVGQSFHFPAMQAAIPMIVPEKDLARASGLNQMLQGAITIAGPPVGAFLLGVLSMQWVLAVDIITAIIAVSCILPMLIPQPARTDTSVKASVMADMIGGFRYIWNWRGLMVLIGLAAVIQFFLMPAYTLLPILVTTHLNGEVLKLGWLNSAFGVGMVAGGLILGVWGGFKSRIITGLLGVMIAGLATAGLGFTSMALFSLGVASSLLVGMGLSFANGPILAALQSLVAKEMQGRVFALLGSLSGIITPIGLAIAGPVADAVGIRILFFGCGVAIMLASIISFFIPSLMNLEKTPAVTQTATADPPVK
jgi:MFS transporter, DHA3 family, macrolide efflux protein